METILSLNKLKNKNTYIMFSSASCELKKRSEYDTKDNNQQNSYQRQQAES